MNNRVPDRPDSSDSAGWSSFLASYQQGHWQRTANESASSRAHADAKAGAEAAGTVVPRPPSPTSIKPCSKHSRKVYYEDGQSIDSSLFFEKHKYLAAPPLPKEKRRLRHEVLLSHGFTEPQVRPSVSRYVRHARSVFRCDFASVSVACSDERSTLFLATEGSVCSRTMATLTAMGGHALLLDEDEVFVVSDISTDWRFQQLVSQHDHQGHALRFFASAPISLSTALDGERGSNLAHVGRLTIMRHDPWPEFSDNDAAILLDIAGMAQEALENDYLHKHATKVRSMQREATSLSYRLNKMADQERASQGCGRDSELGILRSPVHMSILTDSVQSLLNATSVSAIDVSSIRITGRRSLTSGKGSPHGNAREKAAPFEQFVASPFGGNSNVRDDSPQLGPEEQQEPMKASKDAVASLDDSKDEFKRPAGNTFFLPGEGDFDVDPMKPPQIIKTSGKTNIIPEIASFAQLQSLCQFFTRIRRQRLFAKPQWYEPSRDDGSDDDEADSPQDENPIGPLLPSSYALSCAIPVFTSDRTRPILLFLVTWDQDPVLDEADKLFCYTTGIIAAATTLRAQASLADRAQLDFIRSVQHELRTPLNGILGITDFLRLNLITNEKQEQLDVREDGVLANLLESIRLSGVNLSTALDDVLDFGAVSGLNRHKAVITLSDVDIAQEVHNACLDELEHISMQERQDRALRVPHNLYSAVPSFVVKIDNALLHTKFRADQPKLKKILCKIISNALRFTDQDGIVQVLAEPTREIPPLSSRRQSIVTPVSADVQWVDFVVEDKGIGMSEEFLTKSLFTPFSKVNSFSQGVGLGVTIAASLVGELGGHLSVQSKEMEGTTVRISLPLEKIRGVVSPRETPTSLDVTYAPFQHSYPVGTATFFGFDERPGHQAVLDLIRTRLSQVGVRFVAAHAHEAPDLVVAHEDGLNKTLSDDSEAIAADSKSRSSSSLSLPKPTVPYGKTVIVTRRPINSLVNQNLEGRIVWFMRPPFGQESLMHMDRFLAGQDEASDASGGHCTVMSPTSEVVMAMQDARRASEAAITQAEGAGDSAFAAMKINLDQLSDSRRSKSSNNTVPSPSRLSNASLSTSAHTELSSDATPVKMMTSDGTVTDAQKAVEEQALPAPSAPVASSDKEGLGPFRVLVVEDNPVNMKLITNVLQKGGFSFVEAKDGQEAVSQYKAFEPSVVLLDISLPIMDGFEACIKMRQCVLKHVPRIIAVTALSSVDDRAKGLEICGMDDWRTKPLSIRTLRADLFAWKQEWESAWGAAVGPAGPPPPVTAAVAVPTSTTGELTIVSAQ